MNPISLETASMLVNSLLWVVFGACVYFAVCRQIKEIWFFAAFLLSGYVGVLISSYFDYPTGNWIRVFSRFVQYVLLFLGIRFISLRLKQSNSVDSEE